MERNITYIANDVNEHQTLNCAKIELKATDCFRVTIDESLDKNNSVCSEVVARF